MSITVQIEDPTLARICTLEAKRCGFCEGREPSLIITDLDHLPPPLADGTLVIGISARPERLSSSQRAGVFAVLSLPFSVREFEEILCRFRKNDTTCVVFAENGRLWVNGKQLSLSKKEQSLFELLYRNRDRVVSDAEMRSVLGDEAAKTNTVAVYLYRLRRKLSPVGIKLRTVRKTGCQWAAETR